MRPGTSSRQNAKYSIYFDKKTGNVLPANLYRPTQEGLHPVPLECSECLSCLPHEWCSCLLPQPRNKDILSSRSGSCILHCKLMLQKRKLPDTIPLAARLS